MSRIGKTPIKIPKGIKVDIKKNKVVVSGEKGELDYTMLPGITADINEDQIIVTRQDDSKAQKSLHGLSRALINNMVEGLSDGFEKDLQVIGTGYTAEVVGPWLKLAVGFAHDILLEIPEGIKVQAEAIPRREQGPMAIQAKIKVSGFNKEEVGKFAAEIKRCRPPLNYGKGKGIRYAGEYIQIKPGKTGATSAG